jgi:hypothetical protein
LTYLYVFHMSFIHFDDFCPTRSVSEGGDIFGDGNIEGMVDEFECKHSCNLYCRWPGFGLQLFLTLDSEKDN